ncbi:MAG: hypothetical protein JRG91_06145, partial [Deltaproteobacteria bacterium]|nr:hypothetical protein [Deltaproteobacteria bacterium]
MERIPASILPFLAALLASASALGFDVAVVPALGPGDETLLDEFDEAVGEALFQHDVVSAEAVQEALGALQLVTVETQKDADRLGVKVGAAFVVVPWITPLAGQNRVEILVYFLPDGRAEMLEQIAIEGDLQEVVSSMIVKLVTKKGLLGSEPPPDEPPPVEAPPVEPPSDEELLDQLEEVQEEPTPEPKPGFGDPFRVSAALVGGYTLLINEPASGRAVDRNGGHIGASIGYVVLQRVGLEIGGDIHVFMGPMGYGFGLAPTLAVHLPVHERILLGARLGIGFYKGATGSQRTSMIVRASMLTEFVLHDRVFVRLELPAFSLVAFGDRQVPAVGLLGLNAGVGFR